MIGEHGFPGRGSGRFMAQFADRHEPTWLAALHAILPFVVLIVLAALVAWTVVYFTRSRQVVQTVGGPAVHPTDPAFEAARLRYARGEIGREDFVRLAGDLGTSAPVENPPQPPEPAQ